jgi:hypothetical protein
MHREGERGGEIERLTGLRRERDEEGHGARRGKERARASERLKEKEM